MSLSHVSATLVLGLILCFEIQCEGESINTKYCLYITESCSVSTLSLKGGCNYWYHEVPTSSTTCNLREGDTAHFTCHVSGTCNTFNVQWYKRRNQNSSEQNITDSGEFSNYVYIDGYCYISSSLIIYNFNNSDNGHYWCQIMAKNCPLQSSPNEYIAVSEDMAINSSQSCIFDHSLIPPMCAEDTTSSIRDDMRCDPLHSTVTMAMPAVNISYSTHYYNSTTTTVTTTSHNNKGLDKEDNMLWLYGLIATIFLFIIFVLVLSLVVVSLKHRAQQKQSKQNTYRYYPHDVCTI